MKTPRPVAAFECLLAVLEQDLLDASDEEILVAAHELGLQPQMKGSIALLGVTWTARLKRGGSELNRQIRAARDRPSTKTSKGPTRKPAKPS